MSVSFALAVVIVVVVAAAAFLLMAVVRRLVSAPLLREANRGTAATSMVGTAFAVLLAFVIFSAYETYSGAKTGAQAEATAVLDMGRTAQLFPVPQREQLRADLVCYARSVIDQEWPAMRKGQRSPLVDVWIGTYRELFGRLDLRSEHARLGFQELLTTARDRTEGRLARLSDASAAVPTPLWLALILGGCIAVLLQFSMADPREGLLVQSGLVAGVAAVVTAGLLVVNFLDHPYQHGAGSIASTKMQQTLVLIRQLGPMPRPPCTRDGRPLRS